jgi:hypothetical protein
MEVVKDERKKLKNVYIMHFHSLSDNVQKEAIGMSLSVCVKQII